jgi:FkbM family methyltransferase
MADDTTLTIKHFQPLSRAHQSWRTLRHETLRRLRVPSYVVSAQGARFRIDTTDFIDRCVAMFGIWDQPQLEQLAAVARARGIDALLDIGANTGFYSVMFAIKKLCPRIVAFEPDPGNYARLMANLRLNDLTDQIEVVPLALGDRAGEARLYEGGSHNRGESTIAVPEQTPQDRSHQVRVARLDDLYAFSGQRLILKIDVEGYEFEVLAGMAQTLRSNACYVQVELYSGRFEELRVLFATLGYRYLHTHDIDHYFTNLPDIS